MTLHKASLATAAAPYKMEKDSTLCLQIWIEF
jgi:hypothetical protein